MARRPLAGNPPISCNDKCHKARGSLGGTDYAVPVGTPVYAPFAGKFTRKGGKSAPTGYYVNVHRPNGDYFSGLHLNGYVGGNRTVKEGDLIAYSGNTGRSTGPHLHAHVVTGGKVVGMEEYLASPAGGGGNAIDPPTKGDEMRLVSYTKNGKKTWARFTGFGIRETTSHSEASRWNDMTGLEGSRTANASLILAWWADEAADNIAAIAASVGQPVVDVEALSQSIVDKLDFGSIVEDVAVAVDVALADDFAALPTAQEAGQAARDAIVKD